MGSLYDSKQQFKLAFVGVALVIAVASLLFSDRLVKSLAREERQKVELWAGAMRAMTTDDKRKEYDMMNEVVTSVLTENKTIPVLLVSENDSIEFHNNINLPEQESEQQAYLEKKRRQFKAKNPPIVIDMGEGDVQYIYYDDSILLKRLNIYPYAQLGIVFVFIGIAFLALTSAKKAEQNKVWVGLSKETAHQLGTPISSLIAWMEYLKLKNVDPSLLKEMEKDVARLEMVADRFSKIGSNPDPIPVNIVDVIQKALDYLGTRISSKVTIHTDELPTEPILVKMNESLFSWVIENLVKNAVDAMGGQGDITFHVNANRRQVKIDITDTGKGIPKSKFKAVFSPGYTTKARGWGLGLSLVKRIVESYNKGKIYVKSSELNKGTTFRIELPLV